MKSENLFFDTLPDREKSLGALLRRPYQFLSIWVYGHLARSGYTEIRPTHGVIFRYISPEGTRITELAERAQMTKQSMGALVEYLETHGYVHLQPDPADGRAKIVQLTERGASFQRDALLTSRRIEHELAQVMGESEIQQLRVLLERLSLAFRQIER